MCRPKVEREKPPLMYMNFVILNTSKNKETLKNEIAKFGGKVVTKISKSVMAVISKPEYVEKMGSRIREAEVNDIHVVSEDFVDEAKNYSGRIPELVIKKSICSWGSDVSF